MNNLLGRISETRANRVKATKAHVAEVRKLLKERGNDEKINIPGCIFGEDTEYDWLAIEVMTYVFLNSQDPEYTPAQAEDDTGQHTIRMVAPEISFFYGDKGDKEAVEASWTRIFEIVDSYDRCPECGRSRIASWYFCGWCSVQLRTLPKEETEEESAEAVEPAENPT